MRRELTRFLVRLPFGASGTPARRALERPMAIAWRAERAPCLPLRMSSISSRTNSPATVLGDLPARAFLRARSSVRFSGMRFPSVECAQLVLRALEDRPLRAGEAAACAVDVEVEHRHGRAERRALAPAPALRGARLLKTPCSRSSALLVRMTCADQRSARFAMSGAQQSICPA